jgi:hypothetical protein
VKKRTLYPALIGAALLALGLGSYAVAGDNTPGDNNKQFVTSDLLNGYQEVTPSSVSSVATGEYEARIDDEAQTITFTLTYAGLETPATQAHIHFGSRYTSGGVSAFLCGGSGKPPCPPTAGTITGVITAADVIGPNSQGIEPGAMAELIRATRAGHTYVNVHSTRFPAGEIRAQVNDQDQRQAG